MEKKMNCHSNHFFYFQGNIEIFHAGHWGSICDDEWDMTEARIACKQMGFPGAIGKS